MNAKMGRPKAVKPKSNDIKVRVDDEIHGRLLEYCREHGLTKAEAIRQGIEMVLAEENGSRN